MKKYLLLLVSILCLTGCTNIAKLDNDAIVKSIFDSDINKPNVSLQGYKLYLPKGMTLIGDLNSNDVLYSDGEKYYLYVDLVSYYNKKTNEYKINPENSANYAKELAYDGKKGYVVISDYDDSNKFLQVAFNNAKIEVITRNPKRALANSLMVLRGIKYNDKIIESLIGTDALTYDEEQVTLENKKANTDTFLEYEEKYDVFDDKDKELPDEDKIDIIDMDQ